MSAQVPSIARLLADMQNQLDDMTPEQLEVVVKSGDNSLLEIKNVAELLSSHAGVLGDTDCTSKPSADELSSVLFAAAHTLENLYQVINLASEADYKLRQQAQKNPTK